MDTLYHLSQTPPVFVWLYGWPGRAGAVCPFFTYSHCIGARGGVSKSGKNKRTRG